MALPRSKPIGHTPRMHPLQVALKSIMNDPAFKKKHGVHAVTLLNTGASDTVYTARPRGTKLRPIKQTPIYFKSRDRMMQAAVSGDIDEVRGHAINTYDILSSMLKTGIRPLYPPSGEMHYPLSESERPGLRKKLYAYRYAYNHPEKLIAAVKDARKRLRASR